MIKLLIYDLDGTLLPMREIHFQSLNRALEKIAGKEFVIWRETHEKRFDGIPTAVKLNILTEEYGLPKNLHGAISREKQRTTIEIIKEEISHEPGLVSTFKNLRRDGYITACFTNSVFETARVSLEQCGLYTILDTVLANDQILYPKPNPQGYLQIMTKYGIGPRQTVIFEDNFNGIRAGFLSGANVVVVRDPSELTEEFIRKGISLYE